MPTLVVCAWKWLHLSFRLLCRRIVVAVVGSRVVLCYEKFCTNFHFSVALCLRFNCLFFCFIFPTAFKHRVFAFGCYLFFLFCCFCCCWCCCVTWPVQRFPAVSSSSLWSSFAIIAFLNFLYLHSISCSLSLSCRSLFLSNSHSFHAALTQENDCRFDVTLQSFKYANTKIQNYILCALLSSNTYWWYCIMRQFVSMINMSPIAI